MNHLEGLKPGDKAVIMNHSGVRLTEVDRLTKTQITTKCGDRFVIKTGKLVGGSSLYNPTRLKVYDPSTHRIPILHGRMIRAWRDIQTVATRQFGELSAADMRDRANNLLKILDQLDALEAEANPTP